MKTSAFKPIFLGSLGIIAASFFSSCADPYAYNQPPTQTTVTTYRSGYEVSSLPYGYRTEIIGGDPYYVYNGTYYRPRSGRYVVVEAPRHYESRYDDRRSHDRRYDHPVETRERIVTQLPSGYRVVTHRGTRYYKVRDTYYQQRGNGYVIVSAPF